MGTLSAVRAAGSIALLLIVTALLAEMACRIGLNALPLFYRRRMEGLERAGTGFLLGWMLLGTGFLGLALAGLFFDACLITLSVILALASARGPLSRPILADAARRAGKAGPAGCALLVLASLPLLHGLLTPAETGEPLRYHLGGPWQFLQANKMLLDWVSWGVHLPLPVDIGYSLPLLAGEDRLVKWQALGFFLAANCLFSGPLLERGRSRPAWLGPLLAVSLYYAASLIASCKNDMAASALFVAGALLWIRRANLLGALFLGFSAIAKLPYCPMVAALILFFPPAARRMIPAATIMILPFVPWLLKTYLATGNPVFPLASSVFPSYAWGSLNDEAAGRLLHRIQTGDYGIADLPRHFLDSIGNEYLLVALLAPGLLLLGSRRRWAAAALSAMLAVYAFPHYSRYMLGPAWLLMLLAARQSDMLPGRFRLASLPLAAYAVIAVFLHTGAFSLNWSDILLSREEFRSLRHTTRHAAISMMRACPAKRVLAVGEWRMYLMPSRMIYNGMQGETPLIWKAVKESGDLGSLRKRFSQLGARHLLYNHVSAAFVAQQHTVFGWDERMVRLYVEFLKRHLNFLNRTGQCDFTNGGFYLYEIGKEPAAKPTANVWFAPGMESLYGTGMILLSRRANAAIFVLKRALRMAPDVGQSWNELGRAYQILGNRGEAYRYLKPYFDEGMMDYYNGPFFANVAIALGKFESPEKSLLDMLDTYVCQRPMINFELALLKTNQAAKRVSAGDIAEAEIIIAEALAFIEEIPPATSQFQNRRILWAHLKAIQGQIALNRGLKEEAACLYGEALLLDSRNPRAAKWRKIAENLPPCPENPRDMTRP